MKKDKEWLKEQINYLKEAVGKPAINDFSRGLNDAYETLESLIDQLDEPEITDPTISKKETVEIPQFVAEWIEESKGVDDDFWEAATEMIRDSITSLTKKGRKVHDWLFGNSVIVTVMLERQKLITRAWLGGYSVEKEPRWVVFYVNDKNKCFKDFNGINGFVYSGIEEAIKFDDEEKAKAVALLTDGQVEEVTDNV